MNYSQNVPYFSKHVYDIVRNPSQYIYNFPSCVCLISDQGTGDKGDLVTLALVL